MKIRNKITLTFTLLTGLLLLIVFGFIYYFSHQYTENEFYQRLKERTNIIAQSYLEKDELNARVYDEILKKHFQALPEEQEAVLRINTAEKTIIDKAYSGKFPPHFISEIFDKEIAHTRTGDAYYTGILYRDNEGDFIVIASAKNLYGQGKMSNLRNTLIIAFLISMFTIYLIGRYYSGKVLNPVSEITEKANEITASNLHLRLAVNDSKDELTELSKTFNHMLDRLETAFEIQTGFVNNASHELRNPLTAILGETEVALKQERSAGEYQNTLAAIEKEAQRLDLLVNSMLNLAQAGQDSKSLFIEPIRVDELLIRVKESIDIIYPDNKMIFEFSKLPDQSDLLIIQGNQSLLQMALTNIMDNACKFSMNKIVTVAILPAGKNMEIIVKDQGIGIPQNELRDIAEPFFRASNARSFKGFGIGLPLAQKIIKIHNGTLQLTSEVLKGTTAKITLPV